MMHVNPARRTHVVRRPLILMSTGAETLNSNNRLGIGRAFEQATGK